MNKVILNGRLTADPEIKYSGELAIATFTLAVNRQFNKDKETGADFIRCKAFGKAAESIEKYLSKGRHILIPDGRIQTGSYENKEGKKVYTTDIIIKEYEFLDSKPKEEKTKDKPQASPPPEPTDKDGFMQIPDNADDSGLPFNF